MAYVRKKNIRAENGKTYTYHQLVRGYREDGKVKQEVVAHLGKHETLEAALAYWQEWAEESRQKARDLMRGAQLMRDGLLPPYRWNPFSKVWLGLLPRDGIEIPGEPTRAGAFAPGEWFYHRGDAADAEREARKHIAKAKILEKRAARIRSVL